VGSRRQRLWHGPKAAREATRSRTCARAFRVWPHGGMGGAGHGAVRVGSAAVTPPNRRSVMSTQTLANESSTSSQPAKSAVGAATTVGSAADGELLQLVSFMVGDEEFAIPILSVQEINRMMQITRVPQSPPFVEGVINL